MKNNKGITLVALVVIIILLIIFSSVAVYTSVKSFEMIDLQKYKTQMQAIQSGLDEFYEEYENFYEKNKETFRMYGGSESEYIELYLSYIKYIKEDENRNKTLQVYIDEIKSEGNSIDISDNYNCMYGNMLNNPATIWWENIAANYGITTDEAQVQKQYYGLKVDDMEELLGVSDIDISEYFVINFQKRYVFSVNSITIDKKDGSTADIYCLYELDVKKKL